MPYWSSITVYFSSVGGPRTDTLGKARSRLSRKFLALATSALIYCVGSGFAQSVKAAEPLTVADINSTLPGWARKRSISKSPASLGKNTPTIRRFRR